MLLHEVVTSEKVPFTYRVAGLGSRFLAWLLDIGIVLLLLVVAVLLGTPLDIAREGVGTAVVFALMFVVLWGYFLLFEWLWSGQTLGKRIMGIRVIHLRGTSPSFFQSAARNLLRVADGLPTLLVPHVQILYGLGFAVAASNREGRRLGDLAAGTLVVHVEGDKRPIRTLPDVTKEPPPGRETLVRQRLGQLSREQKQTIIDLCLRRDQLRISERARLFERISRFCQQRLDLAPEECQSDERFVLKLAGILTTDAR
jgi:uncharacterized RDD family membrane protein YckC